jgi:proteic killer suppression protein
MSIVLTSRVNNNARSRSMDIDFSSRSLQRACNSGKELIRRWGKDRGHTIGRRLQHLAAADNLLVLSAVRPAKLHILKGKRAGQFAVDGDYPYRIIFEPNEKTVPKKPDGGPDLRRITKIKIIEVVNYHDD